MKNSLNFVYTIDFYTYISQGALPADPAVLGSKPLLLWSAVMVS